MSQELVKVRHPKNMQNYTEIYNVKKRSKQNLKI